MDRAKSTYLLVGVNILIGIFVVIFLIMKLSGDAAEPSDAQKAARTGRVPRTAGEIRDGTHDNIPDATGQPEEQQRPGEAPSVEVVQPPNLPADTTWVPQPAKLPEDTLEKVRQTRWILKNLLLAVELYRNRYDEYPPSVLDDENEANAGIESLFVRLDLSGLMLETGEDRWVGNTDEDVFPEDFGLSGVDLEGRERREILDAWGNPLVYYRFDRYAASETYRIDGESQTATPQISRLTEEYHGRDFVQIWSAGPNGENENGGGDDVTSWHIRE